MSAHKFSDQHTFYVINKTLPVPTLIKELGYVVNNALKKIKPAPQVSIEMKFNQVTNRSEQSLGFGYLWVKDAQAYHLLCGRNPDGRERIQETINGNVEELQQQMEAEIDKLTLDTYVDEQEVKRWTPTAWADLEEQVDIIKAKYQPKVEITKLASLVDFKQILKKVKEFTLTPMQVKDVEPNLASNVLRSSPGTPIPSFVSESDLQRIFAPYSLTHGSLTVTINKNRMAFVTFSRTSRDAQFALLMQTKTKFTDRNKKEHTVIFAHAFKH